MKCKKCGNELRETDKICLNCGTLINMPVKDLYDDINKDDDDILDDMETDDLDDANDLKYSQELDALLNSYSPDTKEKNRKVTLEDNNDSGPNYSLFNELNENDDYRNRKNTMPFKETDNNKYYDDSDNSYNNSNNLKEKHNKFIRDEFEERDNNLINDNYIPNYDSYNTNNSMSTQLDHYDVKDLIKLTDNENNYNENVQFVKQKRNFHIGNITFKVVFIVASIILLIILLLLGYKFIKSNLPKVGGFNIGREEDNNVVESKYNLEEYPNYIAGHSWICGAAESDWSLTADTSTYRQYDFGTKGTYLTREFKTLEDSTNNSTYVLDSGTYGLSLDDISNDLYTYKITSIANLPGGYKTQYTYTIVTNKEGTKALYKINSNVLACEELSYYKNNHKY